MNAVVSPGFSLRDAAESDKEFLLWLRKETMSESFLCAGIVLSDAEHADRVCYRFDSARIVLLNGRRAGLLKAYKNDQEWIIVQIQISPDHQGNGLGSNVVNHVLTRAAQEGLEVSLTVLRGNPAKRLYERLGFTVEGEGEDEFQMRWTPGFSWSRDSTTSGAMG